jgi:DNA-binding NtrC family response regulator
MISNHHIYRVLVLSDPDFRINLNSLLPHDENLRLIHIPFPDNVIERPSDNDLILFAIQSSKLKKTIDLAHAWSIQSHAAVIAEDLRPHEIVRLMKAGFSEVFDLRHDRDLLHDWLISNYERDLTKSDESPASGKAKPEDLIIGKSDAIGKVRAMAVQAASFSELTVMIQGETGTGKEMVARLIHEASPRKKGPFIEINCSAIPETLMEAEMLGYEKGAFTDARRAKRGFFELADKGTLFLDEIALMPLSLQNKILKIVEEKKFRRLGGETEISVNVKVVAGTNQDLQLAVNEGRFRQDLFYRLKVFTIIIPPLRERTDDISVLAQFFLKESRARYGVDVSGLHPATETMLKRYRWPGNVRELKHVVERACILAIHGRILPGHLPEDIQSSAMPESSITADSVNAVLSISIPLPEAGLSLDDMEQHIVSEVLKYCDGNQSMAARFLKISRTRLIRKLPGKA